jgi:hypothetical protein
MPMLPLSCKRIDEHLQGAMIMSRRHLILMAATCLLSTAPLPTTAHASPPPNTAAEVWTADLSTIDGDDANVTFTSPGRSPGGLRIADPTLTPASQRRPATSLGMLITAPHHLAAPANRVRAELNGQTPPGAAVDVDARARLGDRWSQWSSAAGSGAVFDQPVTLVQVRITLTLDHPTASPTVTEVRLIADTAPTTQIGIAALGLTYRIYATREGLVGGTTANGHTIVTRDHFVALPSNRALAPRGTGDYTVRACTATGSRCEYAPVWDIGPWNTKDDYWNPSTVREMWTNLPQGTPEAQAAYLNGYNGGKDQFGRTVLNPAGIDLADGTFWDGLQLTDNAWINVSYLWTASGATGEVDVGANGTLNIRSGSSTSFGTVGLAADFAHVPIECWTTGQTITGTFGTTNRWDRLATGQYASHAYITPVSGTPNPC